MAITFPGGQEAGLTLGNLQPSTTVTVSRIANPPADPGHTVLKAWKLTYTGPIGGVTVSAPATGTSFYIGCDASIPMPDTFAWWMELNPPGVPSQFPAPFTLSCNPFILGLVT